MKDIYDIMMHCIPINTGRMEIMGMMFNFSTLANQYNAAKKFDWPRLESFA